MGKLLPKRNKPILRIYQKWSTSLPYLRYRISGSPIPPPYEIKHFWLKYFQQKFSLTTFIETGTYQGWTVAALLSRFERIYSIELDPLLAENARTKFQSYEHVDIRQGNSANVLPLILKDISVPTLFWLDGHYSGHGTAKAEKDAPIHEELEAIAAHERNDHVILIDDARLINGTNDYPTIENVLKLLKVINNKYKIRILDDMIQCFLP